MKPPEKQDYPYFPYPQIREIIEMVDNLEKSLPPESTIIADICKVRDQLRAIVDLPKNGDLK